MNNDVFSEKKDAFAFPLYSSLPIDKSAEVYEQNVADWTEVIKTYQDGLEWCASQGTQHYEDRHKDRGLLLGVLLYHCGC
jgi:hypothetical protein